jgi:hypothetical protein
MEEAKQMSEQTALTVRQSLSPATWEMINQVAPAMYRSRLFGVASPEQAAAVMLKGYELGLSLTASFELVQVVQGKPALSPRGALALLHGHPECAGIKIEDQVDKAGNPVACKVWMKRRNGFEYAVTFTMDDARRAGLIKKDSGWEKYPANMLRWRATGYCADVVFPDILGGLKRADEFGADITPDGDVIEGTWSTTVEAGPEDAAAILQQLVDFYGAEAVLQAGGGSLPATLDEVKAVAVRLMEEGGEPPSTPEEGGE